MGVIRHVDAGYDARRGGRGASTACASRCGRANDASTSPSYAWLGGERVERRRAASRSTDGRIASAVPGRARAARRASTCAGVTLPGLAQRALARVPPRAAGAHAPRRRHRSGPGARTCTRVAERLTPDSYLALARAVYARDGAGRDHVRRRVPLPATTAAHTPFAGGADRRRRRGRHPDHAARRLLPRRRLRRAAPQRRAAAVHRRRRDALGERVSALRGGAARPHRRRDPLRPRGARRPARRPSSSGRAGAPRCTSTSPSSAPRTRPASPRTAARRPSCSPSTARSGPDACAVHATHLTDADVELLGVAARRSACARRPSATSPTASARPPARGLLRSAPTATRSSTSSRRPARVELDARLATETPRPLHAPPSC